MTRAVVFDLDDTLIASTPGRVRTMRQAAQALGVAAPPDAELARDFMDWPSFVEELFPGLPFSRFDVAYRALMREIPYVAVDGAHDALRTLAARVPLGILTNRNREFCGLRMNQGGFFEASFEFVLTLEDLPAAKPDPRAFEPAVAWLQRKLGRLNPNELCYVGDRELDARAALDAGVRFVGVRTGVEQGAGFPAECDILDSVSELPAFLEAEF